MNLLERATHAMLIAAETWDRDGLPGYPGMLRVALKEIATSEEEVNLYDDWGCFTAGDCANEILRILWPGSTV